MKQYINILLFSFSTLLFCSEAQPEYILLPNERGLKYLPEIMIDFDKLDNTMSKTDDFIFIKISSVNEKQNNNISWALEKLKNNSIFNFKNRNDIKISFTLRKIYLFNKFNLYYPSIMKKFTEMRGSAIPNIKQELIIDGSDKIIKIPVKNNIGKNHIKDLLAQL